MDILNDTLHELVAALPDPVFIITESGRYAGVFGGADPDYYHPGSHLVGLSMFDVLPTHAAEDFLEQISLCLREQRLITFEYDLSAPDVAGLDSTTGPTGAIHFEGRISPFSGFIEGERAVIWVARNITQRHLLEAQLRHTSETDPLTGVYNRRRFMTEIAERFGEFSRYQQVASLIMLDLDHFKRINDVLGHQVGDQMLCQVCRVCQQALREVDIFARFGGEEFIILLPHTSLRAAQATAERMRLAIENLNHSHPDLPPLTVSLGVGCFVNNDSVDALISRVDAALYRAKQQGRNRVEVQDDSVRSITRAASSA